MDLQCMLSRSSRRFVLRLGAAVLYNALSMRLNFTGVPLALGSRFPVADMMRVVEGREGERERLLFEHGLINCAI